MPPLSFDRHRAEIVRQTELLRETVKEPDSADLTAPVPTRPDWTLGRLLRHLGGAHRRAEEVVRTRAAGTPPEGRDDDESAPADEDAAALDGRLAEGAERLAETLAAAGPEAEVWTPVPGVASAAFWARRMAFETAVTRADAALVTGAAYTLDEDVALGMLDEWMEYGTSPEAYREAPGRPALLGPGRTLHFHATGTSPGAAGEWLVDLTGDRPVWRHAHQKAAVAARGPLTDLVMLLYGRPAGGVEIFGDRTLLDLWLDRSASWLNE
ncbi:maleylpyruvate isomerase family mycothiol-dependent enzyme [Actinomadura rugatobispora]|uniref:Maleylpyruvate isomerase family mycothiol-dependent enzyme n=1 Tax=Actinomadura rugatobispora TaxID=1994 RepID=A0ABW1A774_9ACTN|nr:maleylpyruvate isomerase family mycothiol-dependent enzyme [Actinomadura rugatobispora]